jgi:hypothetical protein
LSKPQEIQISFLSGRAQGCSYEPVPLQNPEIQERLQEEVDAACLGAEDDFPDYDTIQGNLDSVAVFKSL